MAFAIISDLHSNLAALEAVFNDIDIFNKKVKVDQIYCLGDIIGYGCQPVQVLSLLNSRVPTENIIRGNHEEMYWGHLKKDIDPKALLMISYNKYLIENNSFARELMQLIEQYAPTYMSEKVNGYNLVLSHNGPVADYTNYRLPWNIEVLLPSLTKEFQDVQDTKKTFFSTLLKKPRSLFFFGHTHFPTLFYIDKKDGLGKAIKSKPKLSFKDDFNDSEYILINPGSVGYSRDGNPEASYMIIDEKRKALYHRRVSYNFDSYGYKAAKSWLKESYPEREDLGEIRIENLVERVHKTARYGEFGANESSLPDQLWREYYKVGLR